MFALLSITLTNAQTFTYNGINYSITDATNFKVAVGVNNGFTGSANIPATVVYNSQNYAVTAIGNAAFFNCSGLTSLTIPITVTSILNGAFDGCSGLTSVTIPNSVTSIEAQAFEYCSGLTSVTIPDSVTTIGNAVFFDCSGLTSVTIPNSVTSIESYAFSGCTGLTSVTIGNSVSSIGDNAFANCLGLTSITIPNSVTSIGVGAFSSCVNLTSVTVNWNTPLPISSNVFYGVTLGSVTLNVPAGHGEFYDATSVWTDFIINYLNLAPNNLYLSPTLIDENVAANTIVGSLVTSTSTDEDATNTHTYSLVGGTGSDDNNAFNISGSNLRITNSPDYETKNSYSIRVRTTDQGGLWLEETFTITINDLQEAPRGCWAQVSVGGYHTLAIAQDGTLWAWGDNAYGQLGAGTVGTDELNPKQVSPVDKWIFVSAGEFYSLAIKNDGTLWAWGLNTYGQIGNGTTTQQNIPVKIGTETNWVDVYAGYRHSIARKVDNTIYAWGNNSSG